MVLQQKQSELWEKGATPDTTGSKEIYYDWRWECLLLKVSQKGAAATGARSCFYRNLWESKDNEKPQIIERFRKICYFKVETERKSGT